MTPSLSVVVPSYDTRDLTLRCLDSVMMTQASGLEVVLSDDGSLDGTAEAVGRKYPDVRIVSHASRQGFAAAANAGLRVARGRILFLLNSDTEVFPEAIASLLDAFACRPRLGAAGPRLVGADGLPQWSAGRFPTDTWLFLLASGLPHLLERLPGFRRLHPLGAAERRSVEWVTGAALAIRREAWEAAGPLDEGFGFYAQDLDLCSRLRDAGWEIAIVPGARVRHLYGATIGKERGSVTARYDPRLLWTDLIRWRAKRDGRAAARQAARLMMLGGGLRVLARTLVRPCLSKARRGPWARDTRAFQEALAAVRSCSRGATTPDRTA